MIYLNKINVTFSIYDFDDSPEELTEKIGIEPSETGVAGDVKYIGPEGKPKATVKIKRNMWRLKSDLSPELPLEEQLSRLLDKLLVKKDNLKIGRCNKEIFCAIYFNDNNPNLVLSKELIDKLSELKIALVFDLYFIGN